MINVCLLTSERRTESGGVGSVHRSVLSLSVDFLSDDTVSDVRRILSPRSTAIKFKLGTLWTVSRHKQPQV